MKCGQFVGIILGVLLTWNAVCVNALEEELRTIPTRSEITQSFLLIRPADKPVASAILFAGGHGRLELSPQGIEWGSGNFLVRNRERFAQEGFGCRGGDCHRFLDQSGSGSPMSSYQGGKYFIKQMCKLISF